METATSQASVIVARDTAILEPHLRAMVDARDPQSGAYVYDPARLYRAAELLGRGDYRLLPDGRWAVVASDGQSEYLVDGPTCTCADHAQGHRCKHSALIDLVGRLERAETDAEQAEAGIPASALDPDAEIDYCLTPQAVAALDPEAVCAGCDDTARWHDGPDGACTHHGCDAEGWWQCGCAGFETPEDAA